MKQRIKVRVKNIGHLPGVLSVSAEKAPSKLTLVQYDDKSIQTYSDISLEEIISLIQPEGKVNWIQVQGTKDVEILQKLAEAFHINELLIEDIFNTPQRPKFDYIYNKIYVICQILQLDQSTLTLMESQISFLLNEKVLISFLEVETDILNPIMNDLNNKNSLIRSHGADFLFYNILDCVVDHSFVILDDIDNYLDKLEEELLTATGRKVIRKIQNVKKLIRQTSNAIWPMREVVYQCQRVRTQLIKPETKLHMHDVSDHLSQALDVIENFQDISSSLIELHSSFLNQRINDVMRTLTVVATIFIPLTFVSNIYGMNFDYIPGLHHHLGFPTALGIMFATALGMLYYFHRKKWI